MITNLPGHGARLLAALALCGAISAGAASVASAAGAPLVEASWVENVNASSAVLHAQINSNGLSTSYRFEYISEVAYQANLNASPPREEFAGATKRPPTSSPVGSGAVLQQPTSLPPLTVYHYRVIAINSAGTTTGPPHRFSTTETTPVFHLPDNRGWEMVSPIDKNGGAIQGFGGNFGGDVLQAAADGNTVTYSSSASFGAGSVGAPAASQYLGRRGNGGWATENITTPLLSGSYGQSPNGVPYQLFSTDLSSGLLSNGERCRGQVGECPVANPPLPGSGAPSGYRDYYLRNNGSGAFGSLLSAADLTPPAPGPEQFELRFVAASPDLSHVVLSSCAALTSNATEVAAPGGCNEADQNLYEWSGSGLSLINLLPGESHGTPGATIGAQSAAISADGNRVYWAEGGSLYLREGGQSKLLPESAGASFQTASQSTSEAGRFAFFLTAAGHLYRYDATGNVSTDLTPGGEVQGVLGASADGSEVYYLSSGGLFLWNGGTTTKVAAGAGPGDYPPTIGTARVSADGSHLVFLSSAELTDYDSRGMTEVFLYGPPPEGGAPKLVCVSCRPSGERPQGSASIPGAVANGKAAGATKAYKPRVLSSDGSRVFFDTADSLVIQDTDNRPDVYEWEASGVGSCGRELGCVNLISDGRGGEASTFVDASANGSDAFFLTAASLVAGDPGSYDLYDARENGGFPPAVTPAPCNGDSCQVLPAAPEDPTPGTLGSTAGNLPVRFPSSQGGKKHKKHKKHHKKHKKHHKGGGKR